MRRREFESHPVLSIFDNSTKTLCAHDVAVACCLAMAEARVRFPLGAFEIRVWESLAVSFYHSACFGRRRQLVQIQPP